MITVRHAPLVYASTAYLDFRRDFIGAPEDLTDEARKRALKLVLSSLDYAEHLIKLDDEGRPISDDTGRLVHLPRWVMFRAGRHLVAGVAASAPFLSHTLTHELHDDGPDALVDRPRRRLHAFAGTVFRLDGQVAFIPPRTQAFYSTLYEEVVGPRFRERRGASHWEAATPTGYRELSVEQVPTRARLEIDPSTVQIHPDAAVDELWASSACGSGDPSLCTSAPSGRHRQQQTFDVVTQSDVATPRTEPRSPASRSPDRPAVPKSPQGLDRASDVARWDAEQAEAKRRTWHPQRSKLSRRKDREPEDDGDPSPGRDHRLTMTAALIVAAVVGGILLVSGMLLVSRK